jgi:crotonobetainyl-CoA:carnitine CoA-transferase CaiB-like acyl-CoA transferase
VRQPDVRIRELPLSDLKVLDLSRILAGPYAATVLSDLGADVIKVERTGVGDETRRWGPPFHGHDAIYFQAVNRNRRSVTLDFDVAADVRALHALVGWADIVIENFLPRQYAALGLAALRASSPGTVWVSVRGADSAGPLAGLPGLDAMVQGRAGVMSLTGGAQTGPTKAGLPVADLLTGMYAAVAALAGVIGRRPGAASQFEVPLLECALTALVPYAAQYLATGDVPGPTGNEHPTVVPYGMFSVADGHVMVGAASNGQFAALCRACDAGDLPDDPRFATNARRVENRAALGVILAEAFARRTVDELVDLLEQAGVPCAPVNTVADALAEEQIRGGGLVQSVNTPAGPLRVIGTPIRVNGVRPPIRSAPPELGEHTGEVLAELGVAEEGRGTAAGRAVTGLPSDGLG